MTEREKLENRIACVKGIIEKHTAVKHFAPIGRPDDGDNPRQQFFDYMTRKEDRTNTALAILFEVAALPDKPQIKHILGSVFSLTMCGIEARNNVADLLGYWLDLAAWRVEGK